MEPMTGVSQQIYKMRNQAFRILYDTLLESMGLSDEELYYTLCLNLRRISNAKFVGLTIIDPRTRKPIVSYGAYDEAMMPTCKQLFLKNSDAISQEMINKCKMAQVRKCVNDEICFLKYYEEDAQLIAAGKGECVGISCILGKNLYAAGLVKMPDGLSLKMTDMLDNYLNLSSMLLSRIQALRELGKSNHEMQRILSAIKNILIVIDENQTVIHWNHIAEELFGKIAESMREQPLQSIESLWDWHRVQEGLVKSKVKNQTVFIPEVTFRNINGSQGCLNITFFPCTDGHGSIVLFGEDVTKRIHDKTEAVHAYKMKVVTELTVSMVDNLLECNRELVEKIEKLSMLLLPAKTDVVFNTMGDIISDNGTYADKSVVTSNNVDGIICYIQDALTRSRKMLRVVKDVVKPDVNSETEVNLNAALESAIGLTMGEWEPIAKMERKMRPDLPLYHCRASEMNTVFVNLIRNAAQAIEAKKNQTDYKGTITLISEMTEEDLIISVEDDGDAIDATTAEKIFEPFFTTRKQCGNIGQGLYIAQMFIRKYDGEIKIDQSQGNRKRFEVVLPKQKRG